MAEEQLKFSKRYLGAARINKGRRSNIEDTILATGDKE